MELREALKHYDSIWAQNAQMKCKEEGNKHTIFFHKYLKGGAKSQ